MQARISDALRSAIHVHERLRSCFHVAAGTLAEACTSNGRLDPARLDEHQVDSFELAWTSAELSAAEVLLRQDSSSPSDVDQRLSLVFCADAFSNSLTRFEAIYREHGLDPAALNVIHACADWGLIKHEGAGARALATAGLSVAEGNADFARVPLNESQTMAQDAFRRMAAKVVAPVAEAVHRDDLTVPESILESMRDMGAFGLSIPEEYGGLGTSDGTDMVTMMAVTEALSEASLGAAGSLITRPEILSRALLVGGTEAQKHHWLPRIAAGDPLCAIAITEPDHGSDVASLTLKGSRVDGGWRLNGAKTWCTFAGKAGLLMVVVRTDADKTLGHRGLSLALVEKPASDDHEFDVRQPSGGRLAGKAIPTIGYRGMHSYDLVFQDFFVPDSHIVGEQAGVGKGFYYTMAGMTGGRMQTAARACGVMWAALRAALVYCSDRKIFGKPLLAYPLTQAKLARMAARLAACRRLAYATASSADKADESFKASLVKLLACRAAEMVTREALQLHGGMGYAEETPVSRYFVDARVLSIFEGAEETLALKVIARHLLQEASAVTLQ